MPITGQQQCTQSDAGMSLIQGQNRWRPRGRWKVVTQGGDRRSLRPVVLGRGWGWGDALKPMPVAVSPCSRSQRIKRGGRACPIRPRPVTDSISRRLPCGQVVRATMHTGDHRWLKHNVASRRFYFSVKLKSDSDVSDQWLKLPMRLRFLFSQNKKA